MRLLLLLTSFLFVFYESFAQEAPIHQTPIEINSGQNFSRFIRTAPEQLYSTLELATDGIVTGAMGKQFLFETEIKKKKLNGIWKSRYSNGQMLDSGRLQKGFPDGLWNVWDSSGILIAVREYDADLLVKIRGEIELNHPRFQHSVLAARYKKEGTSALQYFRAIYSFPNAKIPTISTLEEWVLANRNNIAFYHPVFLDCLHHGFFLNRTSAGIVTDSGYYKNGLKEGVWVHRDPLSGLTEKGLYHQGYRKKEWKEYNSKGKLVAISYYHHSGELAWRKER